MSILVIHLFNKHVLSVCLNAVMHEEVVITYWLFLRFHYFKLTTKSLGLGIDTFTSVVIQVFADFLKWAAPGLHSLEQIPVVFFRWFFFKKKVSKLICEAWVIFRVYRLQCRVGYSFLETSLIDRQSSIFFIFTWWIWFDVGVSHEDWFISCCRQHFIVGKSIMRTDLFLVVDSFL